MDQLQIITQELAAEATGTLAAARDFRITSNEQYALAGERLKGIKALRQKIAETFDPHIKRAHDAHWALLKEKQDAEAPLTAAEGVYKTALLRYQLDQETERRRQEALAQEAARKERERLEARAIKAEAKGSAEKAEALRVQAATAPIPVVRLETPKLSGISIRRSWGYKILDASLLPREYMIPDEKKIGAVVRALKSEAKIPGVEVFEEQTLASRST